MPSYFDSYFGQQAFERRDTSSATLTISDGDLTVNFSDEDGWMLIERGWAPASQGFKASGYYTQAAMGDGQFLRHTAFDNVVESWRVKLKFYTADGLMDQIDTLEELLLVRAPRYWTDRRYHKPVYVSRAQKGETNIGYALVSQGQVTLPDSAWDYVTTLNGVLVPIQVSFIRQPFWLGAPPGTVQATAECEARQDWDYNLVFGVEDALPAGQIFCFLEDTTGNIYAGGESEILKWNGTAWAAEATAPVTLSEDVTAAIQLADGDIMFGGNGRIIKLSGGTYSVETTDPSGQVYALIEARDGVIYAGDNGQILKRDTDDTWAVDDTLPAGYIYSFAQESQSSRVFAGGAGEILAQVKESSGDAATVYPRIADEYDHAEQYGSGEIKVDPPPWEHVHLFNGNYALFRFQLDVPAGATIKSARLRLASAQTGQGTTEWAKIYMEDADSAAAIVDVDNNISDRTLTTAYIPWQDTGVRRRRYWFYTPDFSEVLQEVVNRAGWAADQYVAVVVKSDSISTSWPGHAARRHIYSYDLNPAWVPIFEVIYTEEPAVDAGWELVSTLPGGNVRSMLEVGNLLLAGEDGQILGSDDRGYTWGVLSTTPTGETCGLYVDSGGVLWAGDNGNILRSVDGGRTWEVYSAVPSAYCYALIEEAATGDLRAGDDGNILILDASDTVTLGRDATGEDEVFLANHHKTANLTDIKIDDGGAFSDIYPIDTYPKTLLPAVPVVNDALYFGIDTSLSDTGPFCGLIFDIATPAKSTTSYTVAWEYYNGSWTALTTHDETSQLSQPGVRGVFWKQPADWATVAVDSVTGYWVRARVSALTGTLTPPTQQNRDIYSPVWSFAQLDSAQASGNVGSLVAIKLHNRSDQGGPGGSEPLLYANRILAGIKPTEDHANFRAFLNFADEQNPTGVSVDVSVDPDGATSVQADSNLSGATGRRVFFDAGDADVTLNEWQDRVEIELDTTVARDYYGTYKAFLRCKQNGGSAGEVSVRLKVVSGSGGISSLGDIQITESTTDHELIEFVSPITIPVSAQFDETDIGDVTSIIVQIATAATDADLYLYDLFLLPVDHAWIDTADQANTAESSVESGRRLVVDNISIPKAPTRSLVQALVNDSFLASWRVIGGEMRLLPNEEQRLWVLAARTSAAGTALWLSEPEVCHSIVMQKVDRWISGRGAA